MPPRRDHASAVCAWTWIIAEVAGSMSDRSDCVWRPSVDDVVAVAGSSTAHVLPYGISWLMGERGTHPTRSLAVTSTNKAANEMLSSVEYLVPNIGARPCFLFKQKTAYEI